MPTTIRHAIDRITDILGGYERIRCPRCPAQVRFRGCGDEEAKRLRSYMSDHVERHHRPTFPGGGI